MGHVYSPHTQDTREAWEIEFERLARAEYIEQLGLKRPREERVRDARRYAALAKKRRRA